MNASENLKPILKILKQTYPDARCALNFSNPFELLVATILSAQCTDVRVNQVTPALFKKFPTPQKMARASLSEIEDLIRSTGFFKNKSKSILECSQSILEKHQGEVPQTLEELTALRGVGRKTANVVLGNVFQVPGLVVDTHVGRLCRRMGFTKQTDPVKIESEMMEVLPSKEWTMFSHYLISHGRSRCMARNPDCAECEVSDFCPKIGVVVKKGFPKKAKSKRPRKAPPEIIGSQK